jgi:hypothetical protein
LIGVAIVLKTIKDPAARFVRFGKGSNPVLGNVDQASRAHRPDDVFQEFDDLRMESRRQMPLGVD